MAMNIQGHAPHRGYPMEVPLPPISSRDGGFGKPFGGRGLAFNDSLSPAAASNPMAIRGSYDSYVPPPLPPPTLVPIDGPVDPNIQFKERRRHEDHNSPLGNSLGLSFERRPLPFKREREFPDEGYQSIDSLRSSEPPAFGLQAMRQFRPNGSAIDNSMLSKLNRRPQLSASVSDLPPTRPNHTHLSAISLPDRTRQHSFLDTSMTRSPVPMSALSAYSHNDFRSPLGMDHSDYERSPRTRRTNSGSVPDDATVSTQGSYETRDDDGDFPMETSGIRTLHIEDPWRERRERERERDREEFFSTGQKRRASSPPSDDFPLASDNLRRREGVPLSRGSPTPRLTVISQGSSLLGMPLSSRSGSYASNGNLTASSIASLGSFGRRSPVALSPGGMSPIDSPYATPLSSAASPRSALGRSLALQSPHQRNLSEQTMMGGGGRTMASPRKLAEIPKNPSSLVAAKMKGPYMCECCPKKPKKFDTQDELKVHEAEKQYECQFCGNRFKNKNEAERHQNSLHVRRHSWSCSALTGYERAFHDSPTKPGEADTCGYCGDEFPRSGRNPGEISEQDWEERIHHLQDTHKFRECNSSKKFYRADHFRQHLKHSHAGTSGKWTNMLENACMLEEDPPVPTR